MTRLGEIEAARLRLREEGALAARFTHVVPGFEGPLGEDLAEARRRHPRLLAHLPEDLGQASTWSLSGYLDYGARRALLWDDDGSACLVRGAISLCGAIGAPVAELRPVGDWWPNPLWLLDLLEGASLESATDGEARLLSTSAAARRQPGRGRLAARVGRPMRLPVSCALDGRRRLARVCGTDPRGVSSFELQLERNEAAVLADELWNAQALPPPPMPQT